MRTASSSISGGSRCLVTRGAAGRRSLWWAVAFLVLLPASAAANNTPSNEFGTITFTPDGRGMKMSFTPTARVKCDKIVLTQTAQCVFSNGGDMPMKPGDIWAGWKYRDKNTLANGTFVDHAATSEDPQINGDDRDGRRVNEGGPGTKEDIGTAGKNNASGSADSTTEDYPSMPDSFYPPGKSNYTLKIEICASCVAGADAGTVYGCATFEYRRAKGGGRGSCTSTSDADLDPPSTSFEQAVDLFEENHIGDDGNRMCPD